MHARTHTLHAQGVLAADGSNKQTVRETLQAVLPLCSANYSDETLSSRKHRHVLAASQLVDACATQYRTLGKAYFDPTYRTQAYTEIQMEGATALPPTALSSSGVAPTYFEVHEWDPLDAMHRQLLRNALVAQARLIPLREKVGNKLIHAIRNAYLLSKDGTITVEADADKRNGNKKSRSHNDAGKGGSEGEHSVVAITISEMPRQDVTLLDLLDKTGPVPEPILGAILTQLVAILERLHLVCGCIHNDLDARNVYICANSGNLRLSNFFFAQFPKKSPGTDIKANGEFGNKIGRFLGPLLHQSPERMLGLECSFPSDIYSLGFMIRLLLTGELPIDLKENNIQTTLAYKTIMVDGHRLPLKVDASAYRTSSESEHVKKKILRTSSGGLKKMLDQSSGL
jgi:serine/threonine protein kinase